MRKTFLLKMSAILSLLLVLFNSCRQDTLIQEHANVQSKYKIRVLDQDQFEDKKSLATEIGKLRKDFFRQSNAVAKTVQDSILEGAIIETSRVLEIAEGDNVTYTFPVSRTYPNDKIENLVLRKNADNSYSGVLMQYNLTQQERQQFFNGTLNNLQGKVKKTPINNIAVAGKVYTYSYYEGCWEFVYQAHTCASQDQHQYGDGRCKLTGSQAAQPTTIIAAYNHCGDGSSGGGSGGGGTPGGSSPGSGTPGGGGQGGGGGAGEVESAPISPYNTFIFMSFDDAYLVCAQGDAQCAQHWANMAATNSYFNSLGRNGATLANYTPIFLLVKDYLTANNFSSEAQSFLSERLGLIVKWLKLQNNTTEELKLENYKFAHWASNYFIHVNPNGFEYYKNHPQDFDIIKMEDVNLEDYEFANESAKVITDILVRQENNTLSNLDITWPNLEALKEKVKQAISYGVYTTAKYTRDYIYLPMYRMGVKYPSTVYWSNKAIDKIRIDAVTPLVNFNPNTMGWGDLFNIWLFELTPNHFTNNTINFTSASNIVNGNNIYNPSTNAVKNFPKGNWIDPLTNKVTTTLFIDKLKSGLQSNQYNVGSLINGYFNYNTNAFYATVFQQQNLGIQMLGSFPVTATVISKSGNSAVVQFYISNDLGWESGTRFIKGQPGQGNQGVINNKPVGAGLHLGGTITNTFTWIETIAF